jgi:hypothetical protein
LHPLAGQTRSNLAALPDRSESNGGARAIEVATVGPTVVCRAGTVVRQITDGMTATCRVSRLGTYSLHGGEHYENEPLIRPSRVSLTLFESSYEPPPAPAPIQPTEGELELEPDMEYFVDPDEALVARMGEPTELLRTECPASAGGKMRAAGPAHRSAKRESGSKDSPPVASLRCRTRRRPERPVLAIARIGQPRRRAGIVDQRL